MAFQNLPKNSTLTVTAAPPPSAGGLRYVGELARNNAHVETNYFNNSPSIKFTLKDAGDYVIAITASKISPGTATVQATATVSRPDGATHPQETDRDTVSPAQPGLMVFFASVL